MKALFLLTIIIVLSSCNDRYYEENVTLIAINEQLGCEEENIFYKIISYDEDLDYIKDNRDSIVLFSFSDEVLKEENYYSSFFPARSGNRFKVKVSGVFRKTKHNGRPYHCYEASIFLVKKVIYFEDVTDTATFPTTFNQYHDTLK